MTEQPQRTQLSPEEWKQLCLLNLAQLQTHIQGMPPVLEGGLSAMTAEQMAAIDTHLTRGKSFLNAWARAKPLVTAEVRGPVDQAAPQVTNQTNGAEPPRQKRKYTKRAKSDQAVA